MSDHASDFASKLASIQRNLSEHASEPVTLVLVSKGQPVSAIHDAAVLGQRHFGENYLQEALAKVHALADCDLVWHFIGSIQSNKTRDIASHFSWVEGVESARIAKRLSDARPLHLPPLNLLLQVNIDNESGKSGVLPSELGDLVDAVKLLPRIHLRGLMSIPKPVLPGGEPTAFREMKVLFEQYRGNLPYWDTLSMGMSADYELAVKEGATEVRIGSLIFGPRAAKGETNG